MNFYIFGCLLINFFLSNAIGSYIEACDNMIYCQGKILHAVQMSGIFNDSKSFVDMPLKGDFSATYSALEKKFKKNVTPEEVKKIVDQYFHTPGWNELISVTPAIKTPSFVEKIRSAHYKEFALHLCAVWKNLTRKMNNDVKNNPQRHSLIITKNNFVVPGGRFREFYYWDSYWSIEGLLICDMCDVVKDFLQSFIDVVKNTGFIPNGGRIYYKNRSQPPFLTLMVEKYMESCKDTIFVRQNIDTLLKEYNFWMNERKVPKSRFNDIKLRDVTLNWYQSNLGSPRPESYREDVHTMIKGGFEGDEKKQKEFYANIATAAESGWDFSSRWFSRNGPLNMTFPSTNIRNIIPLDLNCILYKVEKTLTKMFMLFDNITMADYFYKKAVQREGDINTVFWDNDFRLWVDFDIENNDRIKDFYASSFYPLWAGINKPDAYETFKKLEVFKYEGGLPTSLYKSGQQWDFPNAWPPLQDIAIEGLRVMASETTDSTMKNEIEMSSAGVARAFLESSYITWRNSGDMLEKYDVTERGKSGHGGEYDVQVGFGWTNGVILKIINLYGTNENGFLAPDENESIKYCCLNSLILANLFVVILLK